MKTGDRIKITVTVDAVIVDTCNRYGETVAEYNVNGEKRYFCFIAGGDEQAFVIKDGVIVNL